MQLTGSLTLTLAAAIRTTLVAALWLVDQATLGEERLLAD